MSEIEQDDESRIGEFIKEASLALDERALAAFVRGMLARRKAVTPGPSEDNSLNFKSAAAPDWPETSSFL